MIEILPLSQLTLEDTRRICTPYEVNEVYRVQYADDPERSAFSLALAPLEKPHTHHYDHFDAETLERYHALLPQGFSFGAYEDGEMVGFLVAEKYDWNNSLWVNEFHVARAYQGQGIGRQLMNAAVEQAKAAGLRTVVCETQNQNVPAVRAYRALGFRLEGVDISYYTNADYDRQAVAIFMKRRI